jgi:hypothetical protein
MGAEENILGPRCFIIQDKITKTPITTMKYKVTVIVEGNPDFKIEVEAKNEGKAQTTAMFSYPHKLMGQFVSYRVSTI